MKEPFVFTEIINCAEVGAVMLSSYIKHHTTPIHVFATQKDMFELGEFLSEHPQIKFIDVTKDATLHKMYQTGHQGTAYLFAKVLSGEIGGEYESIVHIDSDIFIKKECLSLLTSVLENADIVGSRRCYKKNPANIPVPDGVPDTISTYFFGMKRSAIPKGFNFVELMAMCSGTPIGIDHIVFDFFCPIVFHARRQGASVAFVNPDLIGGQDANGIKISKYKSNMHLDCGEFLMHFGGAGSGCAYSKDKAFQNKAYGEWALIRWELFQYVFFKEINTYEKEEPPPVYDKSGRWVSGYFDQNILKKIRDDLRS